VEVGTAIALLGRPDEHVDDVDAVLAQLGVAAPAPPQGQNGHFGPAETPVPATNGHTRQFASPLARRLATEAGLLLTDLTGTGPGGRIVRRDVEAAVAQRVAPEEAEIHEASPAATPVPGPDSVRIASRAPEQGRYGHLGPGEYTDEPLSRMRRAVAARLTESVTTAPHFYVRGSARVDALLRMREELNDGAEVRVSVNDLIVKAVARAHQLVPEMNVVWTGDAIRSFTSVDVAVAVATDSGLVTPVLTGVERRSITDVARATRDFAARARAGRLQQRELDGGSISVSNLGMYDVEEFAAIINPPHAAILAVGAARQEPVVTDGQLGVATVLRVTLSVDHRPVDGVIAARWMQAFVGLLERPAKILA
jgi:pyruvate dehydrogenase E2 component (dihydrolipoamide acetyltransferase)